MGSQVAKKKGARRRPHSQHQLRQGKGKKKSRRLLDSREEGHSTHHKTSYIDSQRQPCRTEQRKEILAAADRARHHRGDAAGSLLIAQQRAPGKSHQPQPVKALLMQDGEHIVGLGFGRRHQQNGSHAKRPQHQKQINPAILVKQPARDLPNLQVILHEPLHSRNRSSSRRRSGDRLTISPPACHTPSITRRCSCAGTEMRIESGPTVAAAG